MFAMFQIPGTEASQEEEDEEGGRDDSGLTAPDEGPPCGASEAGSTTSSLKRKKRTQKLDEALIQFLNRPRQSDSLKQSVSIIVWHHMVI